MNAPDVFLRSPPFPWVERGVAAVSARRCSLASTVDGNRLDDILAIIADARVGGSFWAPPLPGPPPRCVIVDPNSPGEAQDAVARALADFAAADICVLFSSSRGAKNDRSLRDKGIRVATGAFDPWAMIRPGVIVDAAPDHDCALVTTIAGATPAGADVPSLEERRRRVSRAVFGPVYRDPFTGTATTVEQTIALLSEWRRTLDRNRDVATATGIAWWKRQALDRMLWTGRTRPFRFARTAATAVAVVRTSDGGKIAAWPSRAPARLTEYAAAADIALATVEDGFIRSMGLGSDLLPPLSVVVDGHGVHYDPSRPSDLERCLAETHFSPALTTRADALIDTILRERIVKYGTGRECAAPQPRGKRRRVLVAGQVEDDQSVLLGGAGVTSNLDLLSRARAAEPGAEIWFRPHPDVDAGHRRGAIPDRDALRHADRVTRDRSMASVLDAVDGVHVLTSLTGFEALLRGRDVTTHGQPFYAGWGLTTDLAPAIARRTRRLTLAQLVAGTLILYPRYLDPVTQLPCSPEVLVARLAARAVPRPSLLTLARRAEGRLRRSWQTSFAA